MGGDNLYLNKHLRKLNIFFNQKGGSLFGSAIIYNLIAVSVEIDDINVSV